jgi:hypothetical protein
MITDMITQKKVLRFFGSSVKDCWRPEFAWNITNNQKWSFQIKTNSRVDYFSLILYGQDLITCWLSGNMTIRATIHRPHKHCKIEKFDLYENDSKIKISFLCYAVIEDIFMPSDASMILDPVKNILFDVHLKQYPILIKFCNLKAYSLSDSCGSPEKPLHSLELIKEKSFIVFSCEEDFYLEPISNQKVICGQLGKWNKPFPKCVAKTYCPLPAFDRIDHFLHIEYKDLNYINGIPFAETYSIAIYSCHSSNDTDFELKGEVRRVCKHGFWSGSQPKCVPGINASHYVFIY